MHVVVIIIYLVMGIVQLFAISDGVKYLLGISGYSFISGCISMVLTYVPIVGSLAGVYGAYHAWGWELWKAFTLFFWYIPLIAIAVFTNSDRHNGG